MSGGYLHDAYFLAAALTALDRPTTAAQVRQWASRGQITRHGKDARGRTLYDWREVKRHIDGRHTDRAA